MKEFVWHLSDVEIVSPVKKADILHPFESFMDEAGKAFFNMVSSLHTSRVSSYGFTAEAFALGITHYKINEQLDARTCPVCREMHGKVFAVKDARNLLDTVVRVTNPDDLKSLQPWPSQSKDNLQRIQEMTTEELVAQGWHVPPFHPRCRGLLYRVGKVPTMEQVKNGTADQRAEATKADFLMVGVQASQSLVSKWNQLMEVLPASMVATLLGVTSDKLMLDVFTKIATVGIDSYEEYVKLKMVGKYYGVDKLSQNVLISAERLELTTLTSLTGVEFMSSVKNAYVAAKDAGVAELRVARASHVFDLSVKGFEIDGSMWVLKLNDIEAMTKFLS